MGDDNKNLVNKELGDIVYEVLDGSALETMRLLSSFGVSEDVVSLLLENGYNVELLKIIERDEVVELTQQPLLAERTKLIAGLNKWRKSLGLPTVSAPTVITTTTTESNRHASRLSSMRREDITASFLIQSSSRGQQILDNYSETRILTSAQRKVITHIIVDEFKDTFGKLTSVELSLRAAELHTIFPSETEHSWFQPAIEVRGSNKVRLGRLSKGSLRDRNNNYNPAKTTARAEQHSSTSQDNLFTEQALQEYEQIKTWIRHHEDEWDAVKIKWTATSQLRLSEVSKLENRSCNAVLQTFPTLQKPEGYQLIQIDFNSAYPDKADLLFECWENFRSRIQVFFESDITDDGGKKIYEMLGESNVTADSNDYITTILLAYILPSAILSLTGRKKWKPTYIESRDSVVLWIKALDELQTQVEVLNARYRSKSEARRPLVIAVGPRMTEVTSFLVQCGEVFYELPTFQKALDVCFKIYKAYGLPFPRESAGCWNLISHCLYKFPSSKENEGKVLSISNAVNSNVQHD